ESGEGRGGRGEGGAGAGGCGGSQHPAPRLPRREEAAHRPALASRGDDLRDQAGHGSRGPGRGPGPAVRGVDGPIRAAGRGKEVAVARGHLRPESNDRVSEKYWLFPPLTPPTPSTP